jgi:putative autoinducer-2 (AI-2) aldolase
MLAVDHGYFLGPTEGLENPREVISPLLPFTDSIMLTRGILRTSVRPESCVPVVLRVSGGSSIIGEDLSKEAVIASIEDAIRLNASCLAVSVFIGSKYEHQTLTNLARLVDEGERYGIPILAVTAVGREMARDSRYLGLS